MIKKQKEQEDIIKKQMSMLESDTSNKDNSLQIEEMKAQLQLVNESNKILLDSQISMQNKVNANKQDANATSKTDVNAFVKQAIQSKMFNQISSKLYEQEQKYLDMIGKLESERSANELLKGNQDEYNDQINVMTKQLELVQ